MNKRPQSARQKVLKAERALGELSLSVTTQADKKRIDLVQAGLKALDDEQADLKATIDDLLASILIGYSVAEVIEDLRDLSKKWWRAKR